MGGSFHFGWMLSVSICAALLSQPFTNSFSSDYNALGLNKELLEAGNYVFFCVCVSINIPSIPCSLLINLGSCLLVYIHICIYMHICIYSIFTLCIIAPSQTGSREIRQKQLCNQQNLRPRVYLAF